MTRTELGEKIKELRALRGVMIHATGYAYPTNGTSDIPPMTHSFAGYPAIPALTPEQEIIIALYDFLLDLEARL